MTTVQDFVSTFVSLTPLDIFKENSGKIFWQDGRSAGVAPLDVSSCAGGDKNIYFKTLFLKPNRVLSVPQPNQSALLWRENLNKREVNLYVVWQKQAN